MGDYWRKAAVLGRGTYGTVYLAANGESLVAVKCSTYPFSAWLKMEGEILSKLGDCPEIIQCVGEDQSFESGREVYSLLLEYASGGTLENLIKKHGGLMPESMVARYSYMLLKGLSHVHKEGFVHCDMKPANVLVFPSKDGSSIPNLKIADFGLAKKFKSDEEEIRVMTKIGRFVHNRGTLVYSSPESIAMGVHNPTTDIWSLGCIIVEMFTGKRIWSNNHQQNLLWEIAVADPRPESISGEAKDFLNKCLAKDHKQRWTAEMLLNHPFIVKNLESLPPDFDNLVNPFTGGAWSSTIHLFTINPPAIPILYPRQLCVPSHNVLVVGPVGVCPLLPHRLYARHQKAI